MTIERFPWLFHCRALGWLVLFMAATCLANILKTIILNSAFLCGIIAVESLTISVSMSISLLVIGFAWVWYRPVIGLALALASILPFIYSTLTSGSSQQRDNYRRLLWTTSMKGKSTIVAQTILKSILQDDRPNMWHIAKKFANIKYLRLLIDLECRIAVLQSWHFFLIAALVMIIFISISSLFRFFQALKIIAAIITNTQIMRVI